MTNVQALSGVALISTLSVLSSSLIGCATQDEVKPSEMTLQAAMTNVAQGLVALKAAERTAAKDNLGNPNWNEGLMPSSVSVTFQLAASKTNSNQLMISASAAPPVIPASVGGSDTFASSASGNRSSSITINYSSLYFNPTSGAAVTTTTTTNYYGGGFTNTTSTNGLSSSTNYVNGTTTIRPSNLNDPAAVTNMIKLINDEANDPHNQVPADMLKTSGATQQK